MVAVLVLVLITSAGIFGYLSNAYQGATLDFETQSTQLQVYQEQVEQLKIDKAFLQDEMKSEIDAMPDNYATAKRKARAGFMEKINPISDRIYELTTTISDLKIGLVESGVDVGPVIFIAQAFETSVDTVVKFFIFILIFVFDPLAITLVVAANMVLLDYAQALYEASPKPKKSFWDKFKWKKKESMYGDESYEKLKLGDDDIEYSKGTYGHPVIEPPLVEIKDKVNPSDEFINKAGLKP
jgi:hypothetical protein